MLDFAEKRLRDQQFLAREHYSEVELPHLFEIIQDARRRYKELAEQH